ERTLYPLTLRDQTGADITLPTRPTRIVSTAPSNTEILFALGLGDRIVGVTSQCDYPPEARERETVGDFRISLEKVASLRPDLVVAVGDLQPELVRRMRDAGMRVLVLNPYTWPKLCEAITLLGKATDAGPAAARLVASLKETRARVLEATADLSEADRPKVFVEINDSPLMTPGPNAFVSQIIREAGGRSIAYDANADWAIFNPEVVVARNPDVIITTVPGGAAEIAARQGWDIISAVKSGRVYEIDPDIVSRPGPRLADGLVTVLGMLHPDIARRLDLSRGPSATTPAEEGGDGH
ncbi:MAG: ABC transporter substrate-binding protein, partial [Armatimonadota bacterium]